MTDKQQKEQAKREKEVLGPVQDSQEEALKAREQAVTDAVKAQQDEAQSFVDSEREERDAALQALEDDNDAEVDVGSGGDIETAGGETAAENPLNTPEGQRARKANARVAREAEKQDEENNK